MPFQRRRGRLKNIRTVVRVEQRIRFRLTQPSQLPLRQLAGGGDTRIDKSIVNAGTVQIIPRLAVTHAAHRIVFRRQ